MLTLPVQAAALAKIATKKDNSPRYSMHGVWLERKGSGWLAAATDCKSLLLAEGDNPDDWPVPAVLDTAPNGEAKALIPTATWRSAFAAAEKLTAKAKGDRLKRCGVVMSRTLVTLGATDGVRVESAVTEPISGRFPMVEQIIPKSPPVASVAFDAYRMADMLRAVGDMCDAYESEGPRVVLELRGQEKPVILRVEHPAATGFTKIVGLVMPMGDKPAGSPLTANDAANQWTDTVDRLEGELRDEKRRADRAERDKAAGDEWAESLKAERDQLRERVRELEQAAAALRAETDTVRGLNATAAEVYTLTVQLGECGKRLRDAEHENEELRAELESARTTPAPTPPYPPIPSPNDISPPVRTRRTLGQLAAARTGGA